MRDASTDESSRDSVASFRTMNIVVALMLMIVATVVMISSYELGAGWAEDIGPDSGYFPFYVALFLFLAAAATLVQHLRTGRGEDGGSFINRRQLKMVLQVLVPATIFVALSVYIGIYVSMILFIGFFMRWHGKYSLLAILPVVTAVPVVLFVVFEVWFLVPLPKGPIEAWLGF